MIGVKGLSCASLGGLGYVPTAYWGDEWSVASSGWLRTYSSSDTWDHALTRRGVQASAGSGRAAQPEIGAYD